MWNLQQIGMSGRGFRNDNPQGPASQVCFTSRLPCDGEAGIRVQGFWSHQSELRQYQTHPSVTSLVMQMTNNCSMACEDRVVRRPRSRGSRKSTWLALAASLAFGLSAAHAAVLINLDATGQPLGTLEPWPNTGTISGDFVSSGSIWFWTPGEVITVDGVRGVAIPAAADAFTGTVYDGPNAPATICGDASRTIEQWVWDPQLQPEKTVFSWGHRGGPDGSNMSFNHSTHATWGILGGWGFADIGFTNVPSPVLAQQWTYVVYTYDKATKTARVYQNGVLMNTEVYTNPLATHTNDTATFPIPFRVARQTAATGSPSNVGLGTNIIAKIRLSDVAMTSLQVSNQFELEKSQFQLDDPDGDGMPSWWEIRYGFDPNNPADGDLDFDVDGSTNTEEYQNGTLPNNPDTDGDGFLDGVETNTGTFIDTDDTGTNPLDPDTDGDGLLDGVETGTGTFVNAGNTGSNPLVADSDGDTWDDATEVLYGSDPNMSDSIPTAASWTDAVTVSNPKYWYRFEETSTAQPAANSGFETSYQGAYGPGIVNANLGLPSALPSLGTAIEFTGPAANNATTKYVDMAAVNPGPGPSGNPEIPELNNYRPPAVDKTTTVEYWFKTTQRGTHGNNSWQSPSIMAHESPGDGDMYWGKINDQGEFGFSTSDNNDILTRRDMGKDVTDGNWHHLVMIKEWHQSQPNISTMYLDGGPMEPNGASFTKELAAGNGSYQDLDAWIRYLGLTQAGELENVQYIGFLDEVAIYDRALSAGEVRLHSQAVLGADTDGDTMPDVYELNNGLDPENPADAGLDADTDGLTNLQEYQKGTNPQIADSDGDDLLDGVETDTGIWVSESNTGTDPLNPDTDGDGLLDGVENNNGLFENTARTGTNPHKRDSDGDSFTDKDEITLGTDPNLAASKPTVPPTYAAAVQANNPSHWLRFEETTVDFGAVDDGYSGPLFYLFYGPGILSSDLGKDSATTNLGKALEFTGPQAGVTTGKYIDFGQPITEMINIRDAGPMENGKEVTVEYWFQTTIHGNNGNNTWQNPSIFAHESGGDGDMYYGNFNQDGDFIFSTSDLHDCHVTNEYATDGTWHHVVMSKIWYTNQPCISRLYIDGGATFGGQTIETTTPAGDTSGQDSDGTIQYLGYTQNGDANNAQFIGMIDEVAIYTNAFIEAQARINYEAGGGVPRIVPDLVLEYERVGSDLILTWPSGTLQVAPAVTGPYIQVPGASSPYTNDMTGPMEYFRLEQ